MVDLQQYLKQAPNDSVQRKVDYFITPYTKSPHIMKYMVFGNLLHRQVDEGRPAETIKMLQDAQWSRMKAVILNEMESESFKQLQRFLLLKNLT